MKFIGPEYINEEYEFKFEVVCDENSVHLQDKNGFNFLSINLKDGEKRLLTSKGASYLLNQQKPKLELYLQEIQESYIVFIKQMEKERRLRENYGLYCAKRDELQKQLDGADDSERDLLKFQIKKLDELIEELGQHIVDY